MSLARPGRRCPRARPRSGRCRLLHHRLGDAELVDPLPEHGEREVDVAARVGRDPLALVELEGEVHAALEVEAALERHPGDSRVAHHAVVRPARGSSASAGRGRRPTAGPGPPMMKQSVSNRACSSVAGLQPWMQVATELPRLRCRAQRRARRASVSLQLGPQRVERVEAPDVPDPFHPLAPSPMRRTGRRRSRTGAPRWSAPGRRPSGAGPGSASRRSGRRAIRPRRRTRRRAGGAFRAGTGQVHRRHPDGPAPPGARHHRPRQREVGPAQQSAARAPGRRPRSRAGSGSSTRCPPTSTPAAPRPPRSRVAGPAPAASRRRRRGRGRSRGPRR